MFNQRHQIQTEYFTFYEGGPRTLDEWVSATKQLLNKTQPFFAYNLVTNGLNSFPESIKLKQLAALSLIQTGAVENAREILEPLCKEFRFDESRIQKISDMLNNVLLLVNTGNTGNQINNNLNKLVQEILQTGNMVRNDIEPDEETLGLLARIYKDLWKRAGDKKMALKSRDKYVHAFNLTNGFYTGINAATMSWLAGDKKLSQEIAIKVLNICLYSKIESKNDENAYWLHASTGEALLLLEKEEDAVREYRKAKELAGDNHAWIISSLQQLKLLKKHDFPVPEILFDILKPPEIVVFAGHMIDSPDRKKPRFPLNIEAEVRNAIDNYLDEKDVKIGYSSAACGADILFIESMLNRGAEINIVLPFCIEDFINTSIQYAGPRWVTRFKNVMKLANTVSYVTRENLLGYERLFEFAAQIYIGLGYLRSHLMGTSPELLVVWDQSSKALKGGTSQILDMWPDKGARHIIDINKILDKSINSGIILQKTKYNETRKLKKNKKDLPCKRVIKTMLFADVVGYSKLQDEDIPIFIYEFLEHVAESQKDSKKYLLFVNTWGDAIFAVMDEATPMMEYAIALQKAANNKGSNIKKINKDLNMRIALHAGPVFEGIDPITGRDNFYGAHVNRTARMEPVTVPGCIYASEQFVAMLTVEQVARHGNNISDTAFACEYLGYLSLYKNFGAQSVYHLREKSKNEIKSGLF